MELGTSWFFINSNCFLQKLNKCGRSEEIILKLLSCCLCFFSEAVRILFPLGDILLEGGARRSCTGRWILRRWAPHMIEPIHSWTLPFRACLIAGVWTLCGTLGLGLRCESENFGTNQELILPAANSNVCFLSLSLCVFYRFHWEYIVDHSTATVPISRHDISEINCHYLQLKKYPDHYLGWNKRPQYMREAAKYFWPHQRPSIRQRHDLVAKIDKPLRGGNNIITVEKNTCRNWERHQA